MSRGISLKEAARRYVKKSLIAFIEGGKYARDRKPKNIKWILGVIRSSGVPTTEVTAIIREVSNYAYGDNELRRLAEVKQKVEEMIEK